MGDGHRKIFFHIPFGLVIVFNVCNKGQNVMSQKQLIGKGIRTFIAATVRRSIFFSDKNSKFIPGSLACSITGNFLNHGSTRFC